jgi:alkylmercury lyase
MSEIAAQGTGEPMTTAPKAPALDAYWGRLESHLRPFAPEEQRAALALYRELAKGRAVDADQLGRALGISPAESRTLLQRDAIKGFVYPDSDGRVTGFGGLATAPMHHRFEVEGRTLWTWCAWDSLFIPELLGRSARVTSPDPETKEIVRLVVSPDRVESVVPDGAVVSFIQPEAQVFQTSAANVMANFCHFIFFFASRPSGERWVAKHPGTFLYPLDDAFALAKRLNARNFGLELAMRTRSAAPAEKG